MKNFIVFFCALISLSANAAFACKISPIGASKLVIDSAIDSYTKMFSAADNVSIRKINVLQDDFIEIKAVLNNAPIKTLYKMTINPDCSTNVFQVKE